MSIRDDKIFSIYVWQILPLVLRYNLLVNFGLSPKVQPKVFRRIVSPNLLSFS
jgi:hypothetical protein